MKYLLRPLAGLMVVMALQVEASQPSLASITQPLYFHESATDAKIQLIEVPKVFNTSAEGYIALFASPTKVEGANGDLNLISIYGLSVELVSQDEEGRITKISVDNSKAKKPDNYPWSIAEVTEAAIKAIRMEFKDYAVTKIVVKEGEGKINDESATKPH
jgi:hypothetical protein